MTSLALLGLTAGLEEVRTLRKKYPVPRTAIATGKDALAYRAHGRASVVLLCSHLERYLYAVNEEAISFLNGQRCPLDLLPSRFLLQHSRAAIDNLASTAWLNREDALKAFAALEGDLWISGEAGSLDHNQMLTWMKTPKPKEIKRFFSLFGIDDIFVAVTRTPHSYKDLHLRLSELVDKRNNIAHGDSQTEALPQDVTAYLHAVKKFGNSADRVLRNRLKVVARSASHPW